MQDKDKTLVRLLVLAGTRLRYPGAWRVHAWLRRIRGHVHLLCLPETSRGKHHAG